MPQISYNAKSLASISLDLDNQWSYMKIHGDDGWKKYPSYFDVFLPHVLDLLNQLKLKITFFIVGKDAALGQNASGLREITNRGHEVGNHSMHHDSWLQAYSKEKIRQEIDQAEAHIAHCTGQVPVGFRGPGFCWSLDLLEVLAERRYLFDASTLPTYIGPLARLYYFWKSDLTREERKDRQELFGIMQNGFQPIKPYRWHLPSGRRLLEIPVSTIPIVKTPFHMSYLLYLSRYSPFLMGLYLNLAISLCKLNGVSPSYLLHPLDLIGSDRLTELSFFPGMDLSSEHKARVFLKVIKTLARHFKLVNMSTHAHWLLNSGNLKEVVTG